MPTATAPTPEMRHAPTVTRLRPRRIRPPCDYEGADRYGASPMIRVAPFGTLAFDLPDDRHQARYRQTLAIRGCWSQLLHWPEPGVEGWFSGFSDSRATPGLLTRVRSDQHVEHATTVSLDLYQVLRTLHTLFVRCTAPRFESWGECSRRDPIGRATAVQRGARATARYRRRRGDPWLTVEPASTVRRRFSFVNARAPYSAIPGSRIVSCRRVVSKA